MQECEYLYGILAILESFYTTSTGSACVHGRLALSQLLEATGADDTFGTSGSKAALVHETALY